MAMSVSLRLAKTILNGFDAFFADFQSITLGAKARYERADWQGCSVATQERLQLYKRKVCQVADWSKNIASSKLHEPSLWKETKEHYVELIRHHANFEIAETFFNSIYCEVFDHDNIGDEFAFVLSSQIDKKPAETDVTIYNTYLMADSSLPKMLDQVFDDYAFDIPMEDRQRDIELIVDTVLSDEVLGKRIDPKDVQVDILEPIFYRNKGAYLVGRIFLGNNMRPFVLPILNNEQGALYVDTLICDPEDVSIIFSFTRSYFKVDAAVPSQIVAFLQSLMPHKQLTDLYSCIGFKKHAKTEFYRDFIRHLEQSDDKFIIAPGIKGMVMLVFTLPSYNLVFKIIKDRFTPPKEVTEKIVKEKYRLVTRHDRVGRMADTQEFSNFTFEKSRFDAELLEELREVAPSRLEENGDTIMIKHLYTERRMEPLNLYLADANDEQVYDAMAEYGNAIKQLAAANIFPGDMLLKNFGVTRHGRVVFYDYDEIVFLTDCNFRAIPEPKTEEQAMASTPWYSVDENDVFPEEFRLFFTGNPRARKAFEAQHAELYELDFWLNLQENIRNGKMENVYPYRRKKRFNQRQIA